MRAFVLGAGMMGRAIAYDLFKFSNFHEILLGEKDKQTHAAAARFLQETDVKVLLLDAQKTQEVTKRLRQGDILISALPYRYNYFLAQKAITTKAHFIDLGGNNTIVASERKLFSQAKNNKITIIPDSGLAPGLVSVITHDIVNHMEKIDFVKLRVGGLPRYPKPPLNYQIVFSPYGLINEYVEEALILSHGKILSKKSMTEVETLMFPKPFGIMEAFLTSGGCSTLPYTYRHKIDYLDYKTIRYPGHCEKIKAILDLGFAEEGQITCHGQRIVPRNVFATLLEKKVPTTGEDVVLLKVTSQGIIKGKKRSRDYLLIDRYDKKTGITAMMRTTGYPVSITAQMIENKTIAAHGVFCPEEIIPPQVFFDELHKRGISLSIHERNGRP